MRSKTLDVAAVEHEEASAYTVNRAVQNFFDVNESGNFLPRIGDVCLL